MPSAAFAADADDAADDAAEGAAEATGGIAGGNAGTVPGAGIDAAPVAVLLAILLPAEAVLAVPAPVAAAGLEEAKGRTSIFAGPLSAL